MSKEKRISGKFRKWCHILHRDLSFFFAGVILIYAFSGIMLNHKRDFNSDYSITQKEYRIAGNFPKAKADFSKAYVLDLLDDLGERNNYTQHYFPKENTMKVFIKDGSSLTVNTETGEAYYESVKKRPILSSLNRLHYNPNRNWTIFSDIFAVSLIVITLTGLVMLKGRKGFWGRGGIEFAAGILIPLAFILL